MIRPKHLSKVKALIAVAMLCFCPSLPARAQTSLDAEEIKEIDATEFNVRLTKTSRSGRVLLLADPGEQDPYPGKILLLKSGKTEVAAIRVLKRYRGKFAAKVVLPFASVKVGEEYRALRKIGDKMNEMILEREKNLEDPDHLKTDDELSKEVAPDDAELDRGIPLAPPPKPKTKTAPKVIDPPAERLDDASTNASSSKPAEPTVEKLEVQKMPDPLFNKNGDEINSQGNLEVSPDDEALLDPFAEPFVFLEPYPNAMSFQYAQINNVDSARKQASYTSFGGRYAYNFKKLILTKSGTPQDMLSIEPGIFYYTINGFQVVGDSISVMPISLNLRYSLIFSGGFTAFGYAGLLVNTVLSSENALDPTVLANTRAALGVGGMLNFGPAWALRVDYGIDMLAIGVVLKF